MKRPTESDYTSQVAYTRALEEYCDTLAQPAQEPVARIAVLEAALNEIASAGMSPSPEMSDDGKTAWHASQAWRFIGIAARAIELAPAPVGEQCCYHDSDCAVHNMPAYPAGPCDCSLASLAQPAQEPDIYPEEARELGLEAVAYYTTPPAAQRKPLTDEKKAAIAVKAAHFDFLADYVEAITFVIERTEAAHGIKENT